jgi:hypothetical protein
MVAKKMTAKIEMELRVDRLFMLTPCLEMKGSRRADGAPQSAGRS